MLRMGLRLGERPRLVVTTTPRPTAGLRRLMGEAGCVVSHAPTSANAEHLSPAFLGELERTYGGTRLARQEIEGEVLEAEGLRLWTVEGLRACRGSASERFDRIVVAVDPPAGGSTHAPSITSWSPSPASGGGTRHGSACGIVVVGRSEGRGYVLADRSVGGASPGTWAGAVKAAAEAHGAAEVVAEANQGGDMVTAVLRGAGVRIPVRLVRASEGKRARAEPVAALYEQGRVTHCGRLVALEEEMLALGGEPGVGETVGTDRVDALVWGLSALMLGPVREGPRITVLDW